MSKKISWAAVFLWMVCIFYFSHQPAYVSNDLSTTITEVIVEKIEMVAPHIDFDIGSFNHIVRKNAHFFLYFILGILTVNAFKKSGAFTYRKIGIALLVCVLFAVSDEIHQLFVPGRGSQVKDVLIDSSGATIGIILCGMIQKTLKLPIKAT